MTGGDGFDQVLLSEWSSINKTTTITDFDETRTALFWSMTMQTRHLNSKCIAWRTIRARAEFMSRAFWSRPFRVILICLLQSFPWCPNLTFRLLGYFRPRLKPSARYATPFHLHKYLLYARIRSRNLGGFSIGPCWTTSRLVPFTL